MYFMLTFVSPGSKQLWCVLPLVSLETLTTALRCSRVLLGLQINEQEWRNFSPSDHTGVVLGTAKWLTHDFMSLDFGSWW